MARYLSPGSYFVEVDISDYPAGVNSSVAGVIGYASKGPVAGKSGEKVLLLRAKKIVLILLVSLLRTLQVRL